MDEIFLQCIMTETNKLLLRVIYCLIQLFSWLEIRLTATMIRTLGQNAVLEKCSCNILPNKIGTVFRDECTEFQSRTFMNQSSISSRRIGTPRGTYEHAIASDEWVNGV